MKGFYTTSAWGHPFPAAEGQSVFEYLTRSRMSQTPERRKGAAVATDLDHILPNVQSEIENELYSNSGLANRTNVVSRRHYSGCRKELKTGAHLIQV